MPFPQRRPVVDLTTTDEDRPDDRKRARRSNRKERNNNDNTVINLIDTDNEQPQPSQTHNNNNTCPNPTPRRETASRQQHQPSYSVTLPQFDFRSQDLSLDLAADMEQLGGWIGDQVASFLWHHPHNLFEGTFLGRDQPGNPNRQRLAHLALIDRDFGASDYEMLLQLDEDVLPEKKRRVMRSNARRIDQLPSRVLDRAQAGTESPCVICLDQLKARETVLSLQCNHVFHRDCITKWLKQNETPSCPICKSPALPQAKKSKAHIDTTVTEEWFHT